MIIKSRSRKSPSFDQLVDYVNEEGKADNKYNIYNNLFSYSSEDIKKEFIRNSEFLNARKGGVYMYHEFISITRNHDLSDEKLKQALREITKEYIRVRVKDNLVYGVLHDDHKDHVHYHLIISSNSLEDNKRLRLSKAQFSKIKIDLEKMVLEKYPQLKQEVSINKQAGEKLSNKGSELKRRTGKTPQRDRVKKALKDIFSRVKTKQEFFEEMSKEKLNIYTRGKNIGVIDEETGRKHRLKTLGLMDDFKRVNEIIENKISHEKDNKQEAEQNSPQEVQQQYKTERVKAMKEELKQEQEKQVPETDDLRVNPTPTLKDIKEEKEKEEQSSEHISIKETFFSEKQDKQAKDAKRSEVGSGRKPETDRELRMKQKDAEMDKIFNNDDNENEDQEDHSR